MLFLQASALDGSLDALVLQQLSCILMLHATHLYSTRFNCCQLFLFVQVQHSWIVGFLRSLLLYSG
jgi:hypothetical protein